MKQQNNVKTQTPSQQQKPQKNEVVRIPVATWDELFERVGVFPM